MFSRDVTPMLVSLNKGTATMLELLSCKCFFLLFWLKHKVTDHESENTLFSVFPFPIAFQNNGLSKFGGKKKCIMGNAILIPLQKVIIIDHIHDVRHVGFAIIMQISYTLLMGANNTSSRG